MLLGDCQGVFICCSGIASLLLRRSECFWGHFMAVEELRDMLVCYVVSRALLGSSEFYTLTRWILRSSEKLI